MITSDDSRTAKGGAGGWSARLDVPGAFDRDDDAPDAVFHVAPRLVGHLGDAAESAVRAALGVLLPPGGDLLELGGGWKRHLPPQFLKRRLIGLGANEAELASNPQLDAARVFDLNLDPRLPFADASFDAVFCVNAVAYWKHPVQVFAEVRRVLRPGGLFAVMFGRRCFPTRTVRVWREADDRGRAAIVREYFRRSAALARPQHLWDAVTEEILSPGGGLFADPAFLIHARADVPRVSLSHGIPREAASRDGREGAKAGAASRPA